MTKRTLLGAGYVVEISCIRDEYTGEIIKEPTYVCERGTMENLSVHSIEAFIFETLEDAKRHANREDYNETFAEANFRVLKITGEEV